MEKSYNTLTINQKINLKNNCGLGEIKLERGRYRTGKRFCNLWKGVGAMIKLNKTQQKNNCKNFNIPVDDSKYQSLILPTIFGMK